MIQCILFIFLLILCVLPMCYSGTKLPPTSGPFKCSIVSVKDCSDPRRPYLKNPPIIFYLSVQNTDGKNMLSGNLTVVRDIKDVRIKIKSYFWSRGKWRPAYSFNNLDCHGSLLQFTFSAMNIKYDKKNCMFLKGFFSFKNVDVNQLQHIWVPSMSYRRLRWHSEMYSKGAMFVCKEYETITEPVADVFELIYNTKN